MKKTEDQWSEAEKACVDYHKAKLLEYVPSGMFQIERIGKQLLDDLEPEVFPVFPWGRYQLSNGKVYEGGLVGRMEQGNTFYTKAEAEAESLRRLAETRVREKINIANGGDNIFKFDYNNFYLEYSYCIEKQELLIATGFQSLATWEYIRTERAAKELLKDEDFVADWKLMKGILCLDKKN